MLIFSSTYLEKDTSYRWLQGNTHGHSIVSDGRNEPLEIIQAYEKEGYHFFALSEHDILLKTDSLQTKTKMCLISATEVTSCFNQTLLYLGADRELPQGKLEPRAIMEQVHNAGGLFVFNHPNWLAWPDYTTNELLDTMEGIKGIEIYTCIIERLPGQALATDRWDYLLSKGWRVFGHASDDQHDSRDQFFAWNCVQWGKQEKLTPDGIVRALKEGRFYASTGVTIDTIYTTDQGLSVSIESDADEIHWVTSGSVIVKKEKSGKSVFSMKDFDTLELASRQIAAERPMPQRDPATAKYIRAVCYGKGNQMAWSQPFWIEEGVI